MYSHDFLNQSRQELSLWAIYNILRWKEFFQQLRLHFHAFLSGRKIIKLQFICIFIQKSKQKEEPGIVIDIQSDNFKNLELVNENKGVSGGGVRVGRELL